MNQKQLIRKMPDFKQNKILKFCTFCWSKILF